MLSDRDWARIRGWTNKVTNREQGDVLIGIARISREPDQAIIIRLDPRYANLEPELDDIPGGVGWPE